MELAFHMALGLNGHFINAGNLGPRHTLRMRNATLQLLKAMIVGLAQF